MNLPENLCLTPFIFATIDPAGNQSPCPTLGGNLWNFGNMPLKERWHTVELHNFRGRMLNNEQLHDTCNRCWSEEAVGGYSLRTEVWNPCNDPTGTETKLFNTEITPRDAINAEFYKKGPMQLVMKVNNICNLRCRSCNSIDSYLYKIEGERYAKKYNVPAYFYTTGPDKVEWTDEQLNEIFNFSENLVKLELYGGEPLLDKQTPKLLKKLAVSKRSKHIDLNISTNTTVRPDYKWIYTVSQFRWFNLNMSIDGLGKHFEYIRHPGKWDQVEQNIYWFHTELRRYLDKRQLFTLLPSVTVSILNIYYLPELLTWFKDNLGLDAHLNIATNPHWYNIKNLPSDVKQAVVKKYKQYNIEQLEPILGFMENGQQDLESWEEFKFWTRAKDEYRKESFAETFPEFYEIIKKSDSSF